MIDSIKNSPQSLYIAARAKGLLAVENMAPIRPMIVSQRFNPLDDASSVQRVYEVADGPCGFAWVNIKPANSKFAKFLTSNGLARKDSYNGGIRMSVSEFNQSMAKKETFASAFAGLLRDAGVNAYADSRMD